ncbi:hypothetical protein PF002_g18288 [Phytophthora fragariae]|uniref:Uncharacterized protein n=1 Tax=Phytophthora fragariae TaxID=53985 RepID=A0A6A3EG98_9STRA|nr:hypothetical protein PF003_g5038 [Phytophthora fragariae]KAE8931513.1 hypothetical protein PF009_g18422 [Phytophthora fragariae]KAE9208962.1 hypothetical protein PF004_g16614 [Phytophthora fragariae]KAE9212324.1 hypothetical protein PF002_g18288 [Phytophthora fragariae]
MFWSIAWLWTTTQRVILTWYAPSSSFSIRVADIDALQPVPRTKCPVCLPSPRGLVCPA